LKFLMKPNVTLQYTGIRITAPKQTIFIPGFFCQLMVGILRKFNIFKEDLVNVYQNGAVIRCPGLFQGEMIVMIESSKKSIMFVMMAPDPDLEYAVSVFHHLVQSNFTQYIGSTEKLLCPTCVELSFCGSGFSVGDIGEISQLTEGQVCTTQAHQLVFSKSVKGKEEHCWSHTLSHHDIFLNYRVAYEGNQTPSSSEPSGGIVQMIYERLAVKKKKTGIPIFVYWDKKCLNFGQDWESGFMNGLKMSQLIVLLVSTKTLEGITKAATRQDNVLIEYECAFI